jgi:phosphate starvation-inducible PhoH-like protein
MKMFLTRLGFGAKMVVTGDVTQIDLPHSRTSGLVTVPEVLEQIEDIAITQFDGHDVVRHKLVQRIVHAYKDHGDKAEAAKHRQPAARQSLPERDA